MKLNAALTGTATALLVSAYAGQAIADNKPLTGKYNCTGTATQSVIIGNVAGGSQSAKMKAKMSASRGTFLIGSTTPGWPAMIGGYLEPNMQKVALSSQNETYKTMLVAGCSVTSMRQKATGSQNKNGKKASFTIEQTYSCNYSDSWRVDRYDLTCKR